MQLRDYQAAAIQSVYDWFKDDKGNPLIVAPTGAGKSVILGEFIRRAMSDFPDTRIVVAQHVRELIQQNYAALLRLWPEAPAGVYSAGLNSRQTHKSITFAGIQSVAKKAAAFGYVDLLIVDECHLIPKTGGTQYQRFIEGLKEINPDLKVIGLTATPFRLGTGRLDQGEGAIFDGIAYDIPIPLLVNRGYLAPLISKRPDMVFDVSGIHKRGGDFMESEMADRFNTDQVTRDAVTEVMALGHDRKSWLLFCINVEHAQAVCDELKDRGVPSACVTGDTASSERSAILKAFKSGELRAITNVNVLTTGFDAPGTDLLAFLRPTQSLGLYMQMAGRAMRIADGKENGLVLDFAGNVARHGPVDAIHLPETKDKGKGGDAPTKTCPECQEIVFAGCRECADCGFQFPPPEPEIESTASTDAIMNMTAQEDWKEVRDFDLAMHVPNRDDAIPSLRAEYLIGAKVVREYHCFNHTGFPRQKAVQWWHQNAGTTPPETVSEALERRDEIRVPTEVVLQKEKGYDRISRARVTELEAAE